MTANAPTPKERMRTRIENVPSVEATRAFESAKASMRLLIQAANNDRSLIENRDWQAVMLSLNQIVKGMKAKA